MRSQGQKAVTEMVSGRSWVKLLSYLRGLPFTWPGMNLLPMPKPLFLSQFQIFRFLDPQSPREIYQSADSQALPTKMLAQQIWWAYYPTISWRSASSLFHLPHLQGLQWQIQLCAFPSSVLTLSPSQMVLSLSASPTTSFTCKSGPTFIPWFVWQGYQYPGTFMRPSTTSVFSVFLLSLWTLLN